MFQSELSQAEGNTASGRGAPPRIAETHLRGITLVQLLTQLEYNNEQTKKEESVELLTTLIRVSAAMLATCAAFLR